MTLSIQPTQSMSFPTPELAVSADESLRANTYALLARLLVAPPDDQLLELLRQIDEATGKRGGDMAVGWQMLRLASERASEDQVNDEYHDLFIGLGRGELVPYASWYTTGFLMDRPLALLRRDLAALGIERQEEVHEPEDHAAALCEVMAVLISDGGNDTHETQCAFFNQHIVSWMSHFFRDMQRATSARFYRAVGNLGEQFMEFENQYLDMPV